MKSRVSLLAALVLLALWIYLTFVRAIPSGWVHVPLIVAVVCVAYAIVESDPGTAAS
ncbi:MAG TPA: hypothetical protein VJ992_11700 [Gemmatimonadales bacterium]|nr:hypothetical protein [Gemmatimonadales bacterium]